MREREKRRERPLKAPLCNLTPPRCAKAFLNSRTASVERRPPCMPRSTATIAGGRRAKAYRMLASLSHLGVAALATLEISFRGRPLSFSTDLRLSIVLRSEKRAHLGQAPARTPR